MRISVALATHDGERYLLAQLRSLTQQTLLPADLVLYDDCSEDGTLDVAERFIAEAPFPVRVIAGERRVGPHEAFIRAARASQGELVAFCDQDDIWLEEKLERCARAFAADDVLVAVHSGRVVRHDLSPTGRRCPSIPSDRVAEPGTVDPLFTFAGFAMAFRRVLLEWADWEARPPSRHWRGAMSHDEWVGLVGSAAGRTTFISRPLALYRQHGSQLFGAGRRGPREAVARCWGPDPEAHIQAADVRFAQARYLCTLAAQARTGGTGAWVATNLERSAELRARSAKASRQRADIYARRLPRHRRVARLAGLANRGGYRDVAAGGLGRLALARDLATALSR